MCEPLPDAEYAERKASRRSVDICESWKEIHN